MRLRWGLVACLAALLLPAAKGQAVTVGAPLGVPANVNGSCQSLFFVPVPPSCTLLGLDTSGAWTSQTPKGSWVITRGRVRTGPAVGPMVFTVLRSLRSQAGSPPSGAICCTASAESQVFTPAPNTANEIPLNLPAVNTVEVIDGEPVEVVDYLAISVLNGASSLPLRQATSAADPAVGASLSAFVPAVRQGQTQVLPGGPQLMPLVNGEFESAAATPTAPGVAAPPFSLLPGFRLLPGGNRARLGVNAPGPGLLRAFAPAGGRAGASAPAPQAESSARRKGKAKGKRKKPALLIPARRQVKQAGKAYIAVRLSQIGKAWLRKRGKLTVPVRLSFKHDGGSAVARNRAVTFRKARPKRGKEKAKASAKPAAGPVTAKCGKLKQRAAKRACLKQNKANRVAFNQIKNSSFVGTRGDGAGIDHFFCAGGNYESRTSDSYGTGISTGKRWWIKDATVRRGGKWIDAFLGAPGGYEIALQRRGAQWKFGIASLGRILEPGDVTKTSAKTDCRTL